MAKRHLTQYDSEGNQIPIYLEANEVDVNGRPLDEVIGEGVYDPQYVHTDNNYTTAEKNKLAGLRNYDDTDVQTAIRNINDAIDRLTGTSDTTEIIDTMNEVIDFLSGLDNTDSLANELVSIRQQLANKLNAGDAYNKHQVDDLLDAKQDIINDLVTIRNGARLGATAVQTETDPTVPSWAKQPRKPTYTAAEVGALPANTTIPQGTVTAVKVNDGQPVYPNASGVVSLTISSSGAQVQPDWDETNTESPAYIQNKPDVANAISVNQHSYVMNNNHAFVIPDYYTKSEVDDKVANAGKVKSVSVNGDNHTPDSNGVVDLGTIQGQKGDKGDTGNCQITDDGGNIVSLIINDLTTGGAGNILSAEMGKRLAMLSGTFAAAWAHSKAVPTTFCWLWVEENVDNSPVCKPIWHVGNSAFVDAAGAVVSVDAPQSVPLAPTMTINGSTATSGGSYGKNAELVITPAMNSALYWRIGSGSWNVSDAAVTVTLPSGSLTIEAYCSNQAGNSQTASVNATVAGTATPSFAAATGTTINDGVVSRGGSVIVSVPQGGELHYRVNSGSWQIASGLSVSIPIATNLNQGQMVIEAYNVEDSEESTHVTKPYTMAALAAPTINPASGEVTTGSSVTITAPAGATLKVNGTSIQSQTTTVTITTNNQTITAVSVDTYGESVAATATYTIAVAKIKVKVNADTTMSLGDTGLTAIPLSAANNGENEFTIDDINDIVEQETGTNPNYSSFADHEFASLSFGDNTKIVTFDGGGVKIKSLKAAFQNASAVTSVKGIVMCATSTGSHIDGNLYNAFNTAKALEEVQLSGVVSFAVSNAFNLVGWPNGTPTLDISELAGNVVNLSSAFNGSRFEEIDISGFDTSGMSANDNYGSFANSFANCSNLKTLIIGNLADPRTLGADTFTGTTGITTLVCTTDTPPTLKASGGWLDALVEKSTNVQIKVPASAVNAYKAAQGWSTYEDRISANTDN